MFSLPIEIFDQILLYFGANSRAVDADTRSLRKLGKVCSTSKNNQSQKFLDLLKKYHDAIESDLLLIVRIQAGDIKYIHYPSRFLQSEAVRYDPFNLRMIKEPTEEVQLLAISKFPELVRVISLDWLTLSALEKSCESNTAYAFDYYNQLKKLQIGPFRHQRKKRKIN